jgi:hypothetical protein
MFFIGCVGIWYFVNTKLMITISAITLDGNTFETIFGGFPFPSAFEIT